MGTTDTNYNNIEHSHEDGHEHHHSHEENEAGERHSHGGLGHAHLPSTLGTIFKLGLALTLTFVIIEFIAGLWANSLALISDAGHNLSDALALGFSWWAFKMAKRAPTAHKTYGFHRVGILAAIAQSYSLDTA